MRELGLPLVLGLVAVLALVAVARSVQSRRLWRDRPRVVGTILDRRRHQAYEVSFNVLVEFSTADGREVRGWSANVIGIESAPLPGTQVEVAHDPDDPERFEARPTTVPAPTSPWLWVLVVGIVVWVAFFLWISWS